jgi:hypothetical protein
MIATMRRIARHNLLTLPLILALSACGSGEPEKPGGVTQDEARALDAAAEMLDKRELPDLPEATTPEAAASDQAGPVPSAS